jgi:hypothetical protein
VSTRRSHQRVDGAGGKMKEHETRKAPRGGLTAWVPADEVPAVRSGAVFIPHRQSLEYLTVAIFPRSV